MARVIVAIFDTEVMFRDRAAECSMRVCIARRMAAYVVRTG